LWLVAACGLSAAVGGAAARVGAGRGGDGAGALEARLEHLEERLEGLSAARRSAPTFVVDPESPADRQSASEAVAALARELAELRAGIAGGEAGGDRDGWGARRRELRDLRDRARQDPEARRALAGRLSDPDARVRREALDGLARAGDPAYLGAVQGLLGDGEPGVRARAARAVAELAAKSSSPADRSQAAQALSKLLGDERDGVREQTVEALARVGGPEASAALVRAVADKSFDVQERAVEGLGEAGDPAALATLRQVYGDGSGANALEAAVALKKLGDPSAFQKEAERLRGLVAQAGGTPKERTEALRLLAEHDPQNARAMLDRALRDPSESVRRQAQRALQRMPR
jgi:HEAT repeat protein